MKRTLLALLALALFTGFIVPASKMAELMKPEKGLRVLVLSGEAYFNLSKDYINRPVPCRVIVTSNGYARQDYKFPKAVVSIINERLRQTVLVNNVRMHAPLQIFSQNNIFILLTGLYLSGAPQALFNEMGLDSTKVAYGLANNMAAYIIGNDNDQLFIDNEKTVPIMYRIKYEDKYIVAIIKDYLSSAKLSEGAAKIKKDNGAANIFIPLETDHYVQTTTTLPQNVELYNGDALVQRWVFTDAVLFPRDADIKGLILTPYDIKKLPLSDQTLSPFMLF
jgi:hypothetical protein